MPSCISIGQLISGIGVSDAGWEPELVRRGTGSGVRLAAGWAGLLLGWLAGWLGGERQAGTRDEVHNVIIQRTI